MLPNIPPKLFSFSAVAIGYILIDDLTANEQNALGNWLMLVAQLLQTNAFYKVFEEGNVNQNFNNNKDENKETLIMLEKMVKALQKEIIEIKKEMD